MKTKAEVEAARLREARAQALGLRVILALIALVGFLFTGLFSKSRKVRVFSAACLIAIGVVGIAYYADDASSNSKDKQENAKVEMEQREKAKNFKWPQKCLDYYGPAFGIVREALSEFEAEELIHESVGNLSGGQLQRVLLSMAVMDEPNLLLLDEPVSGIDKNGMDLFYEKIAFLKERHDLAVILVSHDLDYVAKYADNVILVDKEILSEGSVTKVYNSPEFKSVFGDIYNA